MDDEIRLKLAFFSLSAALVLTANAIGYEIGHFNWSGLLSYCAGTAAGAGIFYRRKKPATAHKTGDHK